MEELQSIDSSSKLASANEDRASERLNHGKNLLEDENSDKSTAVECLLKASKLGNEEATSLLADCLNKGTGINEDNRQEVISRVKAAEEESRLRDAIEKLFGTLKKEGQEKISSEDIDEALKRAKEKIEVSFLRHKSSILLV